MTRLVHLVACVGQKLDHPARAGHLYQSDWFRKALAYVTSQGGRWFILSALHGVIPPSRMIEPYNVTLGGMTAADRRAWGEHVSAQLQEQIGPRTPVVILAGRLYRDPIAAWCGAPDISTRCCAARACSRLARIPFGRFRAARSLPGTMAVQRYGIT